MASNSSQHEAAGDLIKGPSHGSSIKVNDTNLHCGDTGRKMKSGDFLDTNGDFKHGVCDILPNNNECESVTLSQCVGDRDCVSSTNDVMSGQNTPSLPHGESTSALQESDTHSKHVAECEDISLQNPQSFHDASEVSTHNSKIVTFNPSVDVSNGAIKKASRKLSKSYNKKNMGVSSGRGRPRKTLVAMYHSQISGDKNAIKIRIKKSNLSSQIQLNPHKKKSGRRKKHKSRSDTDVSDYESSSKRSRFSNSDVSVVSSTEDHEPDKQSGWGQSVPYDVLYRIFHHLCVQEGCLPILVKLCRVCKLWREVAQSPRLWYKIDLNWVKERYRSDIQLHWFIRNRLQCCQDLNLGEWKVRDIQLALEALNEHCPELRALNLSGWKGLNADNLKFVSSEYEKLERLDLSSINSTSALNSLPLMNLAQNMNSRLTHLVLAHNKLASFTQIMAAIASNCPNLQLLDISNIRTFAHTALLHVEKFQSGCPKLRVLRITNSQIWLAPAKLPEQVASPGFPMLEELSVAGLEEDQTTTARSLDDDGIERLLKNSTKLRLLDVRGCIRLSDSGLVRVPAWDLEHLFLSGCYITRAQSSGMELIVQKWNHSLIEVDLAWSTATASLDAALMALAEKGADSPLQILNLCGSSVSLEPVKAVLLKCPNLHSINLQSCRGLPRGIKRLYTGNAVVELRQSFQEKPKTEDGESESSDQPSSEKTVAV